jgi:type II secretory pathway component GspD/PulD (secretin)
MKYLKNKKNNKKYNGLILVSVLAIIAVGTFVTAEGNDLGARVAAGTTDTDKIDALVKSILEGTGSDAQAVADGKAAADKTPKRAVLMDDSEILKAVEVIGDVAEGVAIQELTFNKEMTIADALRFLALKFKKNIIPSPNVDGMITVTKLYNVSFEQALEAIIGLNKYEKSHDGKFIRIYTPQEYTEDISRMIHKVIPLNYITAAEAEILVTPVLSATGAIAKTSAALLNTEPGEGGDTPAGRDYIVVQDYPEILDKVDQIIADVDVAPQQILLEVTILEATLTETTKFGIDWQLFGLTDEDGTFTSDFVQQTGLAAITGGLSVGVLRDNVNVVIEALETITDTTVLANPKILALNKQAGRLLIGREDGYQTTTQISDSGNDIQEISFLKSGTILEFRPFICDDGYIRMEIYPEQSEGTVSALGLPNKSTTTIQSNVMVKDGKTIVLAGLFKEKTNLARNQIPILGDLPFIGGAFRGTDDNSTRVELIILITPHIIKDPEQTNGADRMSDIQRIRYGSRKTLTWLSRARISEDRYKKAVEYYQNGNLDAAMSQLNSAWTIKRTFLDADRLKDRIIEEAQPDAVDRIEWIMLDHLEREESENWLR